jgi:hypothetical protein
MADELDDFSLLLVEIAALELEWIVDDGTVRTRGPLGVGPLTCPICALTRVRCEEDKWWLAYAAAIDGTGIPRRVADDMAHCADSSNHPRRAEMEIALGLRS